MTVIGAVAVVVELLHCRQSEALLFRVRCTQGPLEAGPRQAKAPLPEELHLMNR